MRAVVEQRAVLRRTGVERIDVHPVVIGCSHHLRPGVRNVERDVLAEAAVCRHLQGGVVRIRAEAVIRCVGVAQVWTVEVRLVGGGAVELGAGVEGILVLG